MFPLRATSNNSERKRRIVPRSQLTQNKHVNPYEIPVSNDRAEQGRYGVLRVGVLLFAVVVLTLAFAYAFLVLNVNYVAYAQRAGPIPNYLLLLALVIACCALGLAYSTIQWHSRRVIPSTISFVLILVGLLAGPWLLAILMLGSPG